MPPLTELDLRRRLVDLRRSLIERLSCEPIEPGLLTLLANTQSAISAIDADTVATGPKERER